MRLARSAFAWVSIVGSALFALCGPSAVEAQVKPRFMIAFDTSTSMTYRLSDDTSMGNGIGRPVQPGDNPGQVRDGVFYGCGTFAGLDNDGDCFPDDSRMFIAKEAVRNMVLSFGDVEWALARFAQNHGNYSNVGVSGVSGTSGSCSTCSQNVTPHYQPGWTQTLCSTSYPQSGASDTSINSSGEIIVGFPFVAGENHAGQSNVSSILKWMDNVETNFQATKLSASLRDACNHANGGDCELFASVGGTVSWTPLGGVLRAASNYMTPVRTADPKGACRPYNVILITDGEEACGTGPSTRAAELLAAGIKTYVVGFATGAASLNAIAVAGGTTQAYFATSQAQLSAALSDIVAASLLSETCNGLDDDCDGITDEDLPAGQFLSCDYGGKRTTAQNNQVKLIRNAAGMLVYPANLAATTPLPAKVVCGSVPDLCTADMMCSGACSNRDDDCDGLIDENGAKNSCGVCPGAVEVCNGLDDNCDGFIDNSVGSTVPYSICGAPASCTGNVTCGLGVGQCNLGTRTCTNGVLGPCVGAGSPSSETCDLVDNDCNGLVDDISRPCPVGTNTGECNLGTQFCRTSTQPGDANGWRVHGPSDPFPTQPWCEGQVRPTAELCDNLDQDCDGQNTDVTPGSDPRLGASCGPGVAECDGIVACNNVAETVYCMGERPQPYSAESCNGMDEDCDGITDENPVAGMGGGPTGAFCGTTATNTGECNMGAFACVAGAWGCVGEVPPSAELCDGLNNDCDGATDEGNATDDPRLAAICGTDVGECTHGQTVCVSGSPSCTPVQGPVPEVCDGLDNDCDGLTDEQVIAVNDNRVGVACTVNAGGGLVAPATQPCPGGPGTCTCTLGVTACSVGAIVCQGNTPPQAEICDGLDNNCDGTPDNGNPGGGGTCGTDRGECDFGTFQCTGGSLQCQGGQGPRPELCDGLDNNCDGLIDNGTSPATDPNLGLSCRTNPVNGNVTLTTAQPCPLGAGSCPCTLGATVCSSGQVTCTDMGPEPELCDGVDNDCDGTRDEPEVPNPDPRLDAMCGTSIGTCRPGQYMCVNGSPACTPLVGPAPETCNGLDDNCNGLKDDNVPGDGTTECWNTTLNPNPGVGTCKKGVERCIGGAPKCDGEIRPALEVCDGLDTNCNGIPDDNPSENPGGGQVCGSNVGICQTGLTRCVNQNATWFLFCDGAVNAGTEICNGDDDDCDGLTDEGDLGGGNCYEDASGNSLDPMNGTGMSGVGLCKDGVYACQVPVDGTGAPTGPARNVCVNAVGPRAEFCDNKDNDCDGSIDEGNPPGAVGAGGAPCGTDVGVCQMGSLMCSGGQQVCTGEIGPGLEICDGLNNDCDQVCTTPTDCDERVDEGIPLGEACSTSGKGDVGECVPGRWMCSAGGQVCDGEVLPTPEVCDALDNDCDGTIDENLGVGAMCGSDVGQCREGTQQCVKGLLVCVGEIVGQPETCDCNDNDCDGTSDEAPTNGALCPSGSACVQCQCALPCSDQGEFGTQCPTGKAAVTEGGKCYCVGAACKNSECATTTIERDGEVLCSPTSKLGTCECKNNACSFRCDGVSCTDGTVCNPLSGACERESCLLPQFACEADERCNGETSACEPDPCADAGCGGDQACRDGTCFGSCAKVECPSGEVCKAGTCEADPCAGVSCALGQVCNPVDATCVTPNTCVLSGCGAGTVCDVVEGCVSDPCLSTRCPDRQICALGECVARCASDQVDCNDTCVDPTSDPAHCGATGDCTGSSAGVACAMGEFCVSGECSESCPEGRVGCGGRCIDPLSDTSFCGASGDCQGENAGSECRGGNVCDDGTCVVFTQPEPDGGTAQADAGTGSDPSKRPDTNARVLAAGGGGCSCSVPAAAEPGATRGTTAWSLAFGLFGVLVWRRRRRSPALARGALSSGLVAVLVTLSGFNQGCNVDPFCLNCGEDAGDDDPNVDEGFGGNPGRRDGGMGVDGRDAQVRDGEVPPRDGSTGDGGDGTPKEVCNGEDDDNDGTTDEGFDLDTDLANCGACGQACVPAHAFGECTGGQCKVSGCDVGFLNLNDDDADGCEYACIPSDDEDTICDFKDNDCDGKVDEDLDLTADVRNCGDCGRTCSFINAATAASCANSVCVFDPSKCNAGWHDQDGNAANGCEYACVKNPASPDAELCNFADDDCDRAVDEGVTDLGMGRTVGAACGTDEGYCIAGVWACTAGQPVCAGQRGPITETCNGVDDNCDGVIDVGTPSIGQQCGIATGECNPGQLVIPPGGCSATVGLTCGGPSFVGPMPEVCDGKDNDCDGLIDEPDAITGLKPEAGQACTNDQNMPRGINFAPTSTEAGECQHGETVCASGVLVCAGEIVPSAELCDGKDNDCDGTPDDNMVPGGSDPQIGDACGEDRGQCTAGNIICNAQGQYFCDRTGQVGPADETCDGVDNDCDGTIDEAAGADPVDPNGYGAEGDQSCEVDATSGDIVITDTERCPPGASNCPCTLGVSVCSGGNLGCLGYVLPGVEVCDGVDNDCNGTVDNGNPGGGGACGEDRGECTAGMRQCMGGSLVCVGGNGPATEICNGLDDDCNGLIDDGVSAATDNRLGQSCRAAMNPQGYTVTSTNPCPLGAGTCPCTLGSTICSAGAVACGGDTGPQPETCDTLDNDCDGVINDGNPGGGAACGTSTGECSPGTYTCTTAGTLVCTGGTQASPEVCDGLDNDCNGVADDGVLAANDPSVGQSCYTNGSGALVLTSANRCPMGPGTCPCTLGATVCSAGGLKCVGDLGPQPELCDVFDQNCDGNSYAGVVDLGMGRVAGTACGTSTGECSQGTWACNAGTVACNGQVLPAPEVCNGRDDDCDGTPDDGNPGGGGACPGDATRSIPPCTAGTMTCAFGSLQCVYPQNAVLPSAEVCDTADNDCDGMSDENFNTNTSIQHCGGCNQACNFPQAVGDPQAIATCNNGTCGILACKTGYVNRDGNWANGCEFQCTVTGTVDVCDGINNDCDFNTDEDTNTVPPQVCVPYNTGVCATNPGVLSPTCTSGAPACNIPVNIHPQYQVTETRCDGLDNDCDGKVDEGYDVGVACNNAPAQGVCFATGGKQCNAQNNGTVCVLNPAPGTASAEICDGKDNNCDGIVDNFGVPSPSNAVSGIAFTKVVDTDPNWADIYMMRYEASRPDAQTTNVATTGVCSRPGVFPWANVTWDEARAACCRLNNPPNGTCTGNGSGWRLCDVEDWEAGCEGPGGTCDWAYDNVSVAQNPTTVCTNYAFTFGTTIPNTNGAFQDYSVNVSLGGTVSDVNVLGMTGTVSALQRVSFSLRHADGTTRTLMNTGNCGNDNNWNLGFDDASNDNSINCSNNNNGQGNLYDPVQSLAAFNGKSTDGAWTLRITNSSGSGSGTATPTGGTLQVCYTQSAAPMCSAHNPSFPDTCNGAEVGPASCANGGSQCADVSASTDFPECYADWGSGQEVYDLSGNLKEWTNTSPLTNVYYLRGGAFNNVEDGRQCDFGITSANRNFRFPTTGFRCCYYVQ